MSQAQLDAIKKELWRQANHLCFDNRGFGKKLLDIAVRGIIRQMGRQVDPDGTQWPKLSKPYARYKRRVRPGKRIGEFDDILKDYDEVMGVVSIQAERMKMSYGITPEAREHANFGINRPFYELSDETVDQLDNAVEKHIERLF